MLIVRQTAVDTLIDLGIVRDAEEGIPLLVSWAESAALTTHPNGNRRYGSFIMTVVKPKGYKELTSVFLDDPKGKFCGTCYDTGFEKVYDVEDGARHIPCQDCKGVDNERQDGI